MAEKVAAETEELPKAIVRRLVKEKLSSISTEGDISILRDALLAFSESARIFIHYLSATSNDICRESKRQTINAEDVFKALEEIEFTEFIEPLRASLEEFRQKNAGKRSKSTKEKEETSKKRKAVPVENVEIEKEEEEEDNDDEDKQEEEKESDDEEETNKKRKVLPAENVEEEDEEEEEGEQEEEEEEEKGSVQDSGKTDDDEEEEEEDD
ncbi:DNA polymerase epsilon subunit 3 [Impatiens glandulifera]|uniref:DNA polymerase epsilon subunit 3 n=1 Tax=Impatiens glandulifera TaxID=253017 RepID=UPI001FB061FA|nr:DNA polymerase epsilon subunit 3 [Impatiens glandulifera]